MMRMAIAENESISNNATGEFIRLFPIMLPATSASLNERLTFLKIILMSMNRNLLYLQQ